MTKNYDVAIKVLKEGFTPIPIIKGDKKSATNFLV